MPSFGGLVEAENHLGAGISYRYKDGICPVTEYDGPDLGDWTLVIVPDLANKAFLADVFRSFNAGPAAPVVVTIDEYSAALLAAPPGKPVEPGDYQTPEQRIAMIREELKKAPAAIFRYVREQRK